MNCLQRIQRRYRRTRALVRKLQRGILRRKRYVHYVEKLPVDKRMVLLESQHGRSLDGNIFALVKELSSDSAYRDFLLYVAVAKGQEKSFHRLLHSHNITGVRLVTHSSSAYFRVLATAGYLINDNTFLYCFIKRKEQIYLNTWHGTPLKTLGRSSKSEYYSIGNAQKTFLDADYVLYPNEFTMEHMLRDYMVQEIARCVPLLMGYPRNVAFFDKERRMQLRDKYAHDGKTVYAYLPTWRGVIGNVTSEEQEDRLMQYFTELDGLLTNQQELYVKMHTVSNSSLSLTGFTHIHPFPEEETYEFLNACDGLVTDYSSVMFDFAVTGRKIILFPYDLAEYEEERGFYFPMSELPFPQVCDAASLAAEMKTGKGYEDTEFLQRFCAYDGKDAAGLLCRHVLLGERCGREVPIKKNGKQNVLMYCGDLALNGVTVSLQNLFSQLDVTERNYYIFIKTREIKRNAFRLLELPEGVSWLGITDCVSLKLTDTIRFKWFLKRKSTRIYEKVKPVLKRLATHEYERVGARASFDTVVHFNGYANYITLLIGGFPCKKVIFAHADMDAELRTRINMKREILCDAYRNFDVVALVTEDLKVMAHEIGNYVRTSGHEPNVLVAKDVIDYQRILEMGKQEILFDEQTVSTVPLERLQEILRSDARKLINIGRFSGEKGHFRLMQQFAKTLAEYPNSYLIILGSRGVMYDETLEEAKRLSVSDHIIIIYYMSNPYALLRQCDAFVFSSFYEGFGLVLAEADILSVPCVSTDIVGPKRFMEQFGGRLVPNSDEGVREGILLALRGELPARLTVDYEKYNAEAVESFLTAITVDRR